MSSQNNPAFSNKRIAKNTIYLYLRTMVVMLVSLYTSRLILELLGETDLGIYNVVGGIVTLMAFLQTAQAKSTSRFITYELGCNVKSATSSHIFSACMTIHIIVSLIILLIAETVGLYIVNYLTSIPLERIATANWVYQFSVMTFIAHFIRVPYDSVIIAHEDMNVYAYMSIIEVALQLLMVYFLMRTGGDSLGLYALSLMVIAVILLFCYRMYVKRAHQTYKFHWTWEQEESKKILSFSSWTLLGGASNTATQQGVSLLLNNYVGLIANTALGFAQQVNIALGRFVSSFTTAFNPQIIKLYAERNYKAMFTLMNRASKFSFALCYIMALPLIINMDFILRLWLVSVPEFTVEFCQLIVICTVIDSTTSVFNTAITATGQVRKYQIGISFSFLLDLVCAWFLLLLGVHPALVFSSRIFTRGWLNMLIGFYYSYRQLKFNIRCYSREVLLPLLLTLCITIPTGLLFTSVTNGWLRLLLTSLVCFLTNCLCFYAIIMNKSERKRVVMFINNKLTT